MYKTSDMGREVYKNWQVKNKIVLIYSDSHCACAAKLKDLAINHHICSVYTSELSVSFRRWTLFFVRSETTVSVRQYAGHVTLDRRMLVTLYYYLSGLRLFLLYFRNQNDHLFEKLSKYSIYFFHTSVNINSIRFAFP